MDILPAGRSPANSVSTSQGEPHLGIDDRYALSGWGKPGRWCGGLVAMVGLGVVDGVGDSCDVRV
jgi:hypothetical protein